MRICPIPENSGERMFPITYDWSDAELGTTPCAYSTSENMRHRAELKAGTIINAEYLYPMNIITSDYG
jgi:hypothetical protein